MGNTAIDGVQYRREQAAYEQGYEEGKRDAEPRWIPAEERSPERNGWYLTTCSAGYVEIGRWAGEWKTYGAQLTVTAWMSLPNPYHTEEESNYD